MEKPTISSEFTNEDIRTLRDWQYEHRKNMSPREEQLDIETNSAMLQAMIQAARMQYLKDHARSRPAN